MTDRELLELAAKAAGYLTPSWYDSEAYIDGMLSMWNPLTDDRDAFMLIVKLGLVVNVWRDANKVYAGNCDGDGAAENLLSDPYAATRRATTRAAAEIGRQMK